MKQVFAISLAILLAGCFGPSAEQKQRAETACEKFVLEKVAEKYLDETHVFDTYVKDGKIVVEVGYRRESRSYSDGDSYSVRICLYDEEKGTIEIPSVLNMGQWKK